MELADFEYALPLSSIAQTPLDRRDGSRLLVLDRGRACATDHIFAELPDLLRPGDCLVVNDSRVIPARVFARVAGSGRAVELLFVEPQSDTVWTALVRPGRSCRAGTMLVAGGEDQVSLRIVQEQSDGLRHVARLDGTIEALLEAHGLPPLPPYIERHAKPDGADWERYQTVYGSRAGSIAAPTAGLHFTPELLDRLRARGIEAHTLTLHVGPATFRPVRTPRIDDHVMASERVTIGETTAAAIDEARAAGRRVVAVGTTVTRALEGAAKPDGTVEPLHGRVDLYIYPGHTFRIVDALVTNFHLPRSSLLMLVAAFAGRDLVLDAYRHAIAAGYRFYSYGDAMLIE